MLLSGVTRSHPKIMHIREFNFQKTELQGNLNRLPVGYVFGEKLLRDFRLNPYTAETDFFLLELYQNENITLYQVLIELLPLMIKSIGGYPFPDIAAKLGLSLREAVESMYLADALTIAFNIRIACAGVDIALTAYCPACGAKNADDPTLGYVHSIEGVDIGFLPSDFRQSVVDVVLQDGIQVDGHDCYVIKMKPLYLKDIEDLPLDLPAKIDLEVMYRHIHSIPNAPSLQNIPPGQVFNDDVFRKIRTLRDRTTLLKASKKLQRLEPEITVMMMCRKCEYEWQDGMPWLTLNSFCCGLLRPPEEKHLYDTLMLLTFGEQAPCKSIAEAKLLPTKERMFWVEKLSEIYKNQKDEMDKANNKSKGKGSGDTIRKEY
ncbi:MAG: hypothetical protein WBB28_01785 [Crinalium sp.]